MLPLFFGMISAICFGVSNVYWKKASFDADFPYLVFFRGIYASFILGIIWVMCSIFSFDFLGTINANATIGEYASATLLCMICSLGLVYFLSSMKHVSVSITVAISSVNIFSILTAVFVLGENFSPVYFLSFVFAFIGIVFCQSFNRKSIQFTWNKGVVYALMATFFWGITYPLFKVYAPSIGAVPLSFILETCVSFAALIWINVSVKSKYSLKELIRLEQLKHYTILGTLLIGGTLFSNIAIQKISVLHLSIVNNLQFIVAVLLSVLLYKERLSSKQLFGIVFIFLSILMTQLFK